MTRTPVTISCCHCGTTIFDDEKWSWGPEGDEGPRHDECEERERANEREASRREIERIKAKEKAGQELTFDEYMTLDSHLMHEAMLAQIFAHLMPPNSITEIHDTKIDTERDGDDTIIRPKIVYSSVQLSKDDK